MSDRTQRRAEARRQAKLRKKELKNTPAAEPTTSLPVETDALTPEPNIDIEFATEIAVEEQIHQISAAQLAANQANAKLSTGPSSPAGLATSSRNNFRHGLTQNEGTLILLETESEAAYHASFAAFQKEWNPKTPTEHDLVERLTNNQWLRRRSQKLQAGFQDSKGLITDEKKHALYRRYEVQHERAFNKALADLMRLRSLQIREQNGFESQRRKEELHILKVKAMNDREKRERLQYYEAEAKLTHAQGKLVDAGLLSFSSLGRVEQETAAQAGQ